MNLPISQFYHVSVDDRQPYQVYGGLQDNSSWVGDSEYPGGITNSRWENLYGGDGFWVFSDPSDPDYVYAEAQGGNIGRINRKTLQSRDIQPKGGYKEKLRFNWNTPIALSPNEKGTLYIGSQYLFRTRDHGTTWERISPDLTTNNPARQQQEKSGGVTIDNSSAEMYTTIYSISESPKAAGQIWVGTDDGNVQLTRDGGKTWTNLTKNLKLGADTSISWVEASRFNPAVAYVAVDRHTYGDMAPYVLKTSDYGATWTKLITPTTPGVKGYAHVVKEDRLNPDILFVGTEFGLFVSRDGGKGWEEFRPGSFPAVAVRDIAVATQGDDLVLATHGRGIWIIDDVSPLRALTPDVVASDVALIPSDTVRQMIRGSGGWPEGDATFVGENSVDGAVITYYQKARHVVGRMKLEILDSNGKVIETLPTSKRKGINRVVWSMRTKPPQVPPAASLAFASTQGQRVMPGTYTVRLTKGDKVTEMPLVVGLDKRAEYTVADRQAQYDAAERVKALFARMSALTAGLNALKAQSLEVANNPATSPANKAKALDVAAKADALRKQVVATTEGGAITGEERLRENMDFAYGAITSTDGRPTNYALARVDALEKELTEVEAGYAALKAEQATALNNALAKQGLATLDLDEVEVEPDGARGGPAEALADGLVGTRYVGKISALSEAGEKD
jgi:nucleotide-binding universal stress UspA family protein